MQIGRTRNSIARCSSIAEIRTTAIYIFAEDRDQFFFWVFLRAATRQIVPRDFIKVPSRQKVENAADHKSPIIK